MLHPNLKKLIASDNGDHFEDFCKAFCVRKYGSAFRPIGGKKDGGRDGIFYTQPGKEYRVYQFSVDEKPERKIEKTFERLKDFLGDKYEKMTELVYITNQSVRNGEDLEESLEKNYRKRVRIRDISWVMAHLLPDDKTLDVATAHYLHERVVVSEITIQPEVYLFFSLMAGDGDGIIDHTLDIRSRVLDALILQELIDTNSENLMLRAELVMRVITRYQWVRERLVEAALKRLNQKHSKKTGVRLINWHKKEDSLCLPHDTVLEIKERRNDATDICEFVASKLKEYIQETPAKTKETERVWQIFQEYLAKVFTKRGTSLIDWAETADYILGMGDLELLAETLRDRGIHNDVLHKAYQYAINRLLANHDKRISAFLARLNEAYLLHLVAGRDLKVHTALERLRQSLTLICCPSVIVPQLIDFLRTGNSLLRRASDSGIQLLITDAYLEEIRNHLRDSLNFDTSTNAAPNDFTLFAVETGKKVKDLFDGLGLQTPGFGNLLLVLNSILGIELIENPINTRGHKVTKLAEALKPKRDNSFVKALADASVFYHIRNHQERAKGHYTVWWLTRETATVKTARELKVTCDDHVYMRLSFLQDMLLLLPCREDLESVVSTSWARDTLLLATPGDTLPNEFLSQYRNAKKNFLSTNPAVNKVKMIERMNAFMSLGKVEDAAAPG